MVRSHKKKREHRKLMVFRKKAKAFYCRDCHKRITLTMHHFYCNKCWKIRKSKLNKLRNAKKF